ncbi:hypothetical protein [Asticcacaulis sp. AC402]|uniref:hypothetical protein n=1 Tax=Asticcacaulis sp. AC402 TaxID=1282361 RepID=UPI0003C3D04F|nr:hypothetical protein [Asticcacaulis sp. AC402]ESQ77148.1 hypothetical protein ABAC402_01750 [Asticcacaulis sp. AC402]
MKAILLFATLGLIAAAPCAHADDKAKDNSNPPPAKTAKAGKLRQAPAQTRDASPVATEGAPQSRGAPERPGGRQGTPGPGSRQGEAGSVQVDSIDIQVGSGSPAQGSGQGGIIINDFQVTTGGNGGVKETGRTGGVHVDEFEVVADVPEDRSSVQVDEVKVVVEPVKGGTTPSSGEDDSGGDDINDDKGGSSYGGDQEEGGRRPVRLPTDGRPVLSGKILNTAPVSQGGNADPSNPAATPDEDGNEGNAGKTKSDAGSGAKHKTGKGQVKTSNPARRRSGAN